MAASITEAELLEAVAQALSLGDPTMADAARTTNEIAAAKNISKHQVTMALRKFQDEGRLVVHKVLRQGLGRMSRVQAYTILPAK